MRIYLLILISFYFIHAGQTQSKVFPPKNEISQDPSLVEFNTNLQKAIAAKDQQWIISVLDKEAQGSFGDAEELKAFIDYWNISSDTSAFWFDIERVINLGGVFLHDEEDLSGRYQFVFPYIYNVDLSIDDDSYNMGIITGKNVNLRDGPDKNAKVVSQLTYDIIYYVTDEQGGPLTAGDNGHGEAEWYKIKTYDGHRQGWVNWKYVYSLMGPRLFLFKTDKGEWKISAFVNGD
jgi:hypothetical protein